MGSRFLGAVAAALIGAVLTGCNKPPAVNPWRDDSIPVTEYGTASSEVVASAGVAPAVRYREGPVLTLSQASPQVPHYPLWWEDPFEDQGDKDGGVAWTWQDYLDMPYGLGRFMLNTMGWPVSAVVTPPGASLVSDGVVGKVHDAQPGESPDPVAGPQDFPNGDAAGSSEPIPVAPATPTADQPPAAAPQ